MREKEGGRGREREKGKREGKRDVERKGEKRKGKLGNNNPNDCYIEEPDKLSSGQLSRWGWGGESLVIATAS